MQQHEKILAFIALLAALLLLGVGAVRKHKVYDQNSQEFEMLSYTKVPERNLVADATFTGVKREHGLLVSTYDRTKKQGKQACPT